MFVLWKDHTAVKEAAEINELGQEHGEEQILQNLKEVFIHQNGSGQRYFMFFVTAMKYRKNAWSWVEHCDWIPALLTGNTNPLQMKRSRCAAGHKAMWHDDFNGLPDEKFLTKLDPVLIRSQGKTYSVKHIPAILEVGNLSDEWAKRLGLSTDVKVGVGTFDAHTGAVGGEINTLSSC